MTIENDLAWILLYNHDAWMAQRARENGEKYGGDNCNRWNAHILEVHYMID
jgi:hypothetical protein